MEELKIGSRYNFTLKSAFNGLLIYREVLIRGFTDVTGTIGIMNVYAEFSRILSDLDPTLKDLKLGNEEYVIVTSFNSDRKIIVPISFIDVESIVKVDKVVRTLKFTLDNELAYQRLQGLLSDNLIEFVDTTQ